MSVSPNPWSSLRAAGVCATLAALAVVSTPAAWATPTAPGQQPVKHQKYAAEGAGKASSRPADPQWVVDAAAKAAYVPAVEANTSPVGSTPTAPATGGRRETPHVSALPDPVAAPGIGTQPFYKMQKVPTIPGLQGSVNLANGDLVLKTSDLTVTTPGQEQGGDRFYNSLRTVVGGDVFGTHWSSGAGQSVFLNDTGDKVYYTGPSGYTDIFTLGSDKKSYVAPAGLNQTLTKNPDGTWKMVAQGSGSVKLFSANGLLTQYLNRAGVGTKYLYDANNRMTSVTDPAGRVTTYEYNSIGKVTKITDPIGRTKTFTYSGDVLMSVTDAAGGVTSFTYDKFNHILTAKSATGQLVTYSYDDFGRLASAASGPDTFTFAYLNGNQAVVTTPQSEKWTMNFDTQGRLTDTTDPIGGKTTQTWNTNSQSTGGSAATGGVYSTRYDSSNNLTGVTWPGLRSESYSYAATSECKTTEAGNPDLPKCATDANGNQTMYAYDTAGNLLSVTDGAGNKTSYIRAVPGSANADQKCSRFAGSVCVKIDPRGNRTTYEYDASGNQTAIHPPSPLGVTRFEYDTMGRKTAQVDPDGVRHTFKYDVLDHVVQEDIAAAGTQPAMTLRYTYDADGKLTYDNAATRQYDSVGRLISRAGESVAYNADGRVATQTDDKGQVTSYRYDSRGNVILVQAPGASCLLDAVSQANCVKLGYDADNREISRVLPGNVTQTTKRDGSGRVTEIIGKQGNKEITHEVYSYAVGQGDTALLRSMVDVVGIGRVPGATTRYTYDKAGRVAQVIESKPGTSGAEASWAYTYDASSNPTSAIISGGNTGMLTSGFSATYNAADQATQFKIGDQVTTPTYDPVGNETLGPNPTIQDPSVGPSRTATTNRAGDVTTMTVGPFSTFNYRYENTPVGSHSLAWAAGDTYRYSHFGLDTITNDATGARTKFFNSSDGKKLGFKNSFGSFYYLVDRLGSPLAITDGNGTVQATYTWDPYGQLRNYSGAEYATDAPHIGYAGGQLDQHTWLTRFGQRWYDPTQGRYTQPDPSGREANNYLYAQANPCNKKDPTGLNALTCAIGLGSAAWGMFGLVVDETAIAAALASIPFTLGSDAPVAIPITGGMIVKTGLDITVTISGLMITLNDCLG